MRFTAIIAALLGVGTFFIVTTTGVHAQSQTNNETEQGSSPTIEKVEPGDTLSGIAGKHETTYQRLFDANQKIKDPDLIYPGQKIRIPESGEELTSRSASHAVSQPAPQAPVPAPAAEPTAPAAPVQPTTQSSGSTDAGVWDRLAMCEATGNWSINTGNGYYGGLQFSLSSWQFVGGSGYPHQASKAEQINRAEKLLAIQGWGAWPACSAQLGLR